jgi:general secretion pathway protein M
MTGRLKAIWMARTPRERWLLGIMLALVAGVLFWLLILRPLGDTLSAAKERHGLAVAALAEARGQAAEISALEKNKAPPLGGPIEAAVGQAASAAGFALSRIEPQGEGRIAIGISAARPQAFFPWLVELERRHGLIVDELSVSGNADRTLSVEATLRARRG